MAFQWIIIKYLKMPNSKMRLKLVCWDKFTPRPEIIHLFSSDNSFLHRGGKLIYLLSPSLIPLASVHSRGTRYPPYVSFVTTPQGGNVPKTPVAWWVKSQGRLWPPLLKQYSVGCFCQSRPLSTARLSSEPSIIFIHRRALAHLCLGVFSAYIHALYMHLHRCVDVERCISKCICVQKNHLAPMSTHIYMRTHWSKPLAWISVFE